MSALEGVKVVEFGSNLGAEYAAWILAEQGARTIKVEPRDGSARRGSSHFHVLNRSKQSLFFDLQAAPERVAELLHWADVVVTGFTPVNLKRLKLDPESVHHRHHNDQGSDTEHDAEERKDRDDGDETFGTSRPQIAERHHALKTAEDHRLALR